MTEVLFILLYNYTLNILNNIKMLTVLLYLFGFNRLGMISILIRNNVMHLLNKKYTQLYSIILCN